MTTTTNNSGPEVKLLRMCGDAENTRKLDAARAEAEAMKVRSIAKAQAEAKSILVKAEAEAEAVQLKALAEAEREELLNQTALVQQQRLLEQHADMLDPSVRSVKSCDRSIRTSNRSIRSNSRSLRSSQRPIRQSRGGAKISKQGVNDFAHFDQSALIWDPLLAPSHDFLLGNNLSIKESNLSINTVNSHKLVESIKASDSHTSIESCKPTVKTSVQGIEGFRCMDPSASCDSLLEDHDYLLATRDSLSLSGSDDSESHTMNSLGGSREGTSAQ